MGAPKNAQLNLAHKRLLDYCQKNKITITNLSTIHLSPTVILTGPCIKSGCSNNFEKTYGNLLTTNGYCTACSSKGNNGQLNNKKMAYNKTKTI